MNATKTMVRLTIQCAWCGRVIKKGKPWPPREGEPAGRRVPTISHGICSNCFAREQVIIRGAFTGPKPSA